MILLNTNTTQLVRVTVALYGAAPGYTYLQNFLGFASSNGLTATANALGETISTASFKSTILSNLGLTGNTIADSYITAQLAAGTAKGTIALNAVTALSSYAGTDAGLLAAKATFNAQVARGEAYSTNSANTSTTLSTLQAALDQAAKTLTLTTGADLITGSDGNDVIVGGLVDAVTASNNTISAADEINAGSGTDTLRITLSGDDAGSDVAATLVVGTITGVENVQLTSTADAAGFGEANTVDLTRASGITTITNKDSTEALSVSGLKSNATLALDAASADTTLAYTSAVDLTGSADTFSITTNGTTAGTVKTANGFETIAITTSGTASTITDIDADGDGTSDSVTKLTVAGDKALTISNAVNSSTMNANLVTIDASGMTAALTVTITTGNLSVVGGSGNDVITAAATITAADTINGGAGVDTLKVSDAATVDTAAEVANISSIERLDATATEASETFNAGLISSLTTLRSSASSDSGSETVTFSNIGNNITNLEIQGTEGIIATKAVDTNTDSITLTIGSTTAGYTAVAATLDAYETINLVSQGAANTISTLTSADATSLVASGSKDITLSTITAGNLTNVNATAMTGAFIMGSAGSANASTVQGGAGNDTLIGGAGNDSIVGNAGADSITGAAGKDTISGGAGNDTIVSGDGNDVVTGDDGVDSITGGSGVDNLSGGAGNDTFTATNAEFVNATAAETVSGGDGTDTLTISNGGDLAASNLLGLSSVEVLELANGQAATVTLTDAVYTANGNSTLTIDADAIQAYALTVSASGLTSANAVVVDVGHASHAADDSIVLGAGNDTVKIDADSLSSGDTITAGSGVDALVFSTGNASNSADTIGASVTGFENVTFATASDSYYLTTDNANVASGATQTVDGSNLTGVLSWTGSAETNGYFSVTGGAGADTLTGGSLADTLSGGSGSDSIAGGSGADSITGGADADSIEGGAGNDVIDAGDGNDASINGGAGIDNLSGGAGNDTFVVAASADFAGLTAAETVSGGAGDDTLEFAVDVNWTINSTDLNLSSVETIKTLGNDDVFSLTLTDAVMSANGVSTVTIDANANTTGNITIAASGLTSAYSLLVDNDLATAAITGHNIVLGAGNDTVRLDADALDDVATITGGSGTDTLQLSLQTTASATTLDDDITGFEVIGFTDSTALADGYLLTTQDANVASGATLTVSGASLTGALTFDGSAETNGYFVINSGSAADAITGGSLADTISSGSGADTITGGLGADSITGGAGADLFVYANVSQSGGTAVDTITDWTSASDKLQVTLDYSAQSTALDVNAVLLGTGVADLSTVQDGLTGKRGEYQYVTGTSQLVVNFNNDNLITAADYKIGLAAASTASATVVAGDVNFSISGGSGADSIVAGGGADTISGGSGADTINGGAGNDQITGGSGADSLTGGSGVDTFVFEATAAANGDDSITDFTVGASGDILNFDAWLGTSAAFLDAGSTTISGAIGATNAGAASGGTSISAKVVLIDTDTIADTTALASLIVADGTVNDLLLLTNGQKAVVLLGDVNSTSTGTYSVYYVIGTDTASDDTETITLVGTLTGVDLDAVVAANLY